MGELKLQQSMLDGRFVIRDCLGRGAYSEVYVADDMAASNGSPRTVVIKALNTHLHEVPDPELERTLIENFRNEAIALDRVRHPNIISRLGHGTAIDLEGRTFHYLVLEYMPGGDLQSLIVRRPLPLPITGHRDASPLRRRAALPAPAADIYPLAKTPHILLTGESPRRLSQ